MPRWLKILAHVGPQILLMTPLAPIAAPVAAAIAAAEQIPGATGAQKKELVKQIACVAAEGANAQAGHQVIDASAVNTAADAVIDGVIQVVNLIDDPAKLPGHTDVIVP